MGRSTAFEVNHFRESHVRAFHNRHPILPINLQNVPNTAPMSIGAFAHQVQGLVNMSRTKVDMEIQIDDCKHADGNLGLWRAGSEQLPNLPNWILIGGVAR